MNFEQGRQFKPDRRRFYEQLLETIRGFGFEVASAVTNEDWGNIELSIPEFTRYDVEQIQSSDVLIVASGEGLSRDIYLEIGLAVSTGVPVVVLIPTNTPQTFMLQGLAELGLVHVHTWNSESEAHEILNQVMLRVVGELQINGD